MFCSTVIAFSFNNSLLSQLHFLTCSAQSNAKIEELLQEDHNAKRRREKYQKQSSLLSKLTRQLSIHDNRAASYANDSSGAGKFYTLNICMMLTNVITRAFFGHWFILLSITEHLFLMDYIFNKTNWGKSTTAIFIQLISRMD
jgi:hypothetical protein